jgi:hypothetical protein
VLREGKPPLTLPKLVLFFLALHAQLASHAQPFKMHPLAILFAYTITLGAQAFEFTGPDTAERLDLSKPITVWWDATDVPTIEPNARALDLWFISMFSGHGGQPSWNIAANLSLAGRVSYEWDPSNLVNNLESHNQTLLADAVHTFEARLLGQDGERLVTIESGHFVLGGPESIVDSGSSSGSRHAVYRAILTATAFAMIGMIIVL